MMHQLEIQAISHNAALRAAKEKRVPFYVTHQDLAMYRAQDLTRLNIPSIGNYLPPTWRRVDLSTWDNQRGIKEEMNAFFVDKGFGQQGEAALTLERFLEVIRPGYGYAIIEEGQFQVYVAVYEHPKKPSLS